ncbi:hybrid sensor histidine kinase/response regulator, partial [Acinetobacter baumannii]|nr:hybrid sensor histidine kinase/response regulator [Acinetobacter baumannii]
MVNLHGGQVEVHSDGLGRGSCFSVSLPLGAHGADGSAGRQEDPALAAHSALRIMIVDDNRDAADSLGIVLSTV